MSSKIKFVLTLIGVGALIFLIFYLYPAEIFDVEIIGSMTSSEDQLSLEAFLKLNGSIDHMESTMNVEVRRKLSGWMVVFICLCGLPLMLAYRSSLSKLSKKN